MSGAWASIVFLPDWLIRSLQIPWREPVLLVVADALGIPFSLAGVGSWLAKLAERPKMEGDMGLGRVGTALAMVLLLAPMAVHAASFDTIVIDDNMGGAKGNGDYAVGQGPTRQEAERIAMSNCTLGGNKACKIKITYQQCGAYASSARTSGIGLGPTMDQASSTALATCHDQTCRVVIADCVDQPLNPPR